MRPLLLASTLFLPLTFAHAQSAVLAGILGSKALLVVDGGAPRALAAGQTHQGVRVVSVARDHAVVEIDSARTTLRLGEGPVSMPSADVGPRLVLRADAQGHFIHSGYINGRSMQYMVDTGASTVAIGLADAQRMGLKTEGSPPVQLATANGTVQGWRVRLDSVRIGPLELRNVDATITPQSMPYVLLGNSFLRAFDMNRTGNQMVLQKK